MPLITDCYGLSYKDNSLYVSGHMSGILRLDLNANTVEAILEPNTENSLQPHGVVAVEHGLVFSDIGSRSLTFVGDQTFQPIISVSLP